LEDSQKSVTEMLLSRGIASTIPKAILRWMIRIRMWEVRMLANETVDDFFERIYWNAVRDRVFVYKSKAQMKQPPNKKNKPEIWDGETTRNYIDHLEKVNGS
jgi:preprotein translocase subunit Sec63|tara:strand:+ start:1190 stop:1495 length:306 start_codon:yes stop_codon:yes gene_type:complete